MKLTKLLYSLLITIIIFSSCSKKDDTVKMIPKNAMMIVHLNMSSFTGKLKIEDIRQTHWFQSLYNDTSTGSLSKKIMDNPQSAGVDLTKDLFIFLQKPANAEAEIVVEGTVSDATAFESFLKQVDASATPVKDGDVTLVNLNNKGVVGWRGGKFAYITNGQNFSKKMGEVMDSLSNKMAVTSSPDQLKTSCKALFALSDDVSMTKVENFSKLLKEKGDLHWWSNSEEVMKTAGQNSMNLPSLESLLKGLVSTATVDFADGKIEMKQKMYGSDALMDIFKKYSGKTVSSDMIKNIPSKNVAAIIALNFQPEGIKELIKVLGFDGIVNMGLSQAGITIDDFVKANKGDVLFSVSDLTVKQDSAVEQGVKLSPDARYLFAVSIGDKASFNKLMDIGKKFGGEIDQEGIHNAINDKYLAIGNNQQFVSGFIQGNSNTFDFTSKFDGHPVCVFVDVQKILSSIPGNIANDSSATKIIAESKKLWENVYSVGGEYKDDGIIGTTEINLLDKKTNSLKQLNQYADTIYVEVEKKLLMDEDKSMKEDMTEDIMDSTEAQ